MTTELPSGFSNLTVLQRRYCEFRAKGYPKGKAVLAAGSNASDGKAASRIGYQMEQIPAVQEYITYLRNKKADNEAVVPGDLIEMLKQVFSASMANEKYKDANTAVELIGKVAGIIGHSVGGRPSTKDKAPTQTGPNTSSFQEDDDDEDLDQEDKDKRMARLTSLIQDLQANKGNK